MRYSKKLSIFEVSLQVAMPARRPIGQYFFEDERGRTVTVNLEQNIAMFNNFLTPAFRHFVIFNNASYALDIYCRNFPGKVT